MNTEWFEIGSQLGANPIPAYDQAGYEVQTMFVSTAGAGYYGFSPAMNFGPTLQIGGGAQFNIAGNAQFNLFVAVGSFLEAQQKSLIVTVESLRRELSTLAGEVKALQSEIQDLRESQAFVVPLTTLAPQPYKMLAQIPVTIKGGEGFTASFNEASVSASGDTEADAIANFKEMLLSLYEIFASTPREKLGPLPARQWNILSHLIQRSE